MRFREVIRALREMAVESGAMDAATVVQSFSPDSIRAGFLDFQAFARALGAPVESPCRLSRTRLDRGGIRLRLGWAQDRLHAA